ncbi:unnamed protein product [Camellia sinensis]
MRLCLSLCTLPYPTLPYPTLPSDGHLRPTIYTERPTIYTSERRFACTERRSIYYTDTYANVYLDIDIKRAALKTSPHSCIFSPAYCSSFKSDQGGLH